MTMGNRLIGHLVSSKAKFKLNRSEDSLEITSSETNGNLTEEGVYKYVVYKDDFVDVYGSCGFTSSKERMEREKKKLENLDYIVSSMKP